MRVLFERIGRDKDLLKVLFSFVVMDEEHTKNFYLFVDKVMSESRRPSKDLHGGTDAVFDFISERIRVCDIKISDAEIRVLEVMGDLLEEGRI